MNKYIKPTIVAIDLYWEHALLTDSAHFVDKDTTPTIDSEHTTDQFS